MSRLAVSFSKAEVSNDPDHADGPLLGRGSEYRKSCSREFCSCDVERDVRLELAALFHVACSRAWMGALGILDFMTPFPRNPLVRFALPCMFLCNVA